MTADRQFGKEVTYMKNFNELNEYQHYENDPYSAMSEPAKGKKSGGMGKMLAIALCCSLLGGAAGAGGTILAVRSMNNSAPASTAVQTERTAPSSSESSTPASKSSGTTTIFNGTHSDSSSDSTTEVAHTKADTGKLMTASEVYKANVNSTVGIRTSITATNYWGYQTQAAASGSGFIISKDGYILTNHHVIDDADSITVTLYDGRSYDAKLIGSDESNDVAVLKVDADDLVPVVLGSSKALSVGEDVLAIGNPLGELTFSLTRGVVSALDRTVTTQRNNTMELIQTDCAINSGNSGGALFNLYGEVVGITNSKFSNNGSGEASIDNIGFAIPIDNIRGIIDALITNGYVMKPYIGITPADLSEDAINYGLPKGAAIRQVTEGTPADEAGLEAGDIITKADDETIESATQLMTFIKKHQAGDEVKFTIYRKGETIEKTVKVTERKQETEAEQKAAREQQQKEQQEQYDQYRDFEGFPGFGSIFGF